MLKNTSRIDINTNKHSEMLDITLKIKVVVKESGVEDGFCILFVPHTTAAITINESADPMVRKDILMGMEKIVQEHDPDYLHAEGNSAGHIKCTLFGVSETLLIQNGELLLGTWQGIFFCEFDGPRRRKLYIRTLKS